MSRLLKENGEFILLESGDFMLLEPTYLGSPVLDVWPNWETLPNETRTRPGVVLDNRTGLPTVKPRVTFPRQSMRFEFRLTTRTEVTRFRNFLQALRGRQKAFWIPTWQHDLVLTEDEATAILKVESIGYEDGMGTFEARRHLAVINHTRTMLFARVIGITDNGTTENVTLNATPTETIIAGASMLSFLLLVRLEADEVQMSYISPSHATVTLPVVEVPNEVPAP